MSFINFNEKILPADGDIFPLNRAIHYGDGLFETIRIHEGEILFFEDHLERMFTGMRALKINVPDYFSSFFFHKQIIDLAYKNQISGNGRIRLTIFRKGNGLYEPLQSGPEYFIEVTSLNKGFEWSSEPCELGVFTDVPKNFSSISFFKSLNALCYVMAGIYKRENNLGDCVLLNASGKIADAVSSNVFWIEKEVVCTVPVSDGGVGGIMRKNLLALLQNKNISFHEKSISPLELKDADEVFLTNVARGIKPVTKFEKKIFSTVTTKEIFQLLLFSLKK